MSAYTTLHISRRKAITKDFEYLSGKMTDSELEAMLNNITEPSLYRVMISAKGDADDEDTLARIVRN